MIVLAWFELARAADPPAEPVPLVVGAKVPVEILLEGVRGCFRQHSVDETQISTMSIQFMYLSNPSDDEDVDKELAFYMKDGTTFAVAMFSTGN